MSQNLKTPFIPDDAPFSHDQKAWLSGFMAALHTRLLASDSHAKPAGGLVNILFGSQTGNAENLANQAADVARAQGLAPVVQGLDEVSLEDFAQMKHVLIATSTYGEGEMPDNAQLFWEGLSASTMPRLEDMQFAVLAIGDTGYDGFCQAGKYLDMRLEQLGAKRIAERIDCDVDYEAAATAWIEATLPLVQPEPGSGGAAGAAASGSKPAAKPSLPGSSRKNPLASRLLTNRTLSGEGSGKDIRHFEFDLSGSGLHYEAGDALGVIPVNDPALVQLLLDRLGVAGDTAVAGQQQSLGELLLRQYEISTPSRDLIQAIGQQTHNEELRHVLQHDDKEALEAWLWGKDVLDLLLLDPARAIGVDELLQWLRPLQHRAYSISSSGTMHPDQVHLTVAAVRYQRAGRQRGGVCSTYMADRIAQGDQPQIFFSPNKAFRVPANPDLPAIMVGPGTGIAPFRAFLQEREASGAQGRNWLFFGDQHRASDFIYEDELTAWLDKGTLHRLDLAFSRDQQEKIYVQTRMRENGKELYAWLQEGGHFYVCGDASRMAKDVDDALHQLVAEQAGISPDKAVEYINALKKDKRYVRDVY